VENENEPAKRKSMGEKAKSLRPGLLSSLSSKPGWQIVLDKEKKWGWRGSFSPYRGAVERNG